MSNAAERTLGTATPLEARPGAASATAHVIAMGDLEASRTNTHEPPAGGAGRAVVAHPLADASHPLRRVKAKLTVCVGAVEVSIGELLEAREQQLLRLDRTVDQPVDVLLEGQVVARGVLVAVDDHFAVRITDLPAVADGSSSR